MRSEKELREKKAELLRIAFAKHDKHEHGFGKDDRTEELDGKSMLWNMFLEKEETFRVTKILDQK